MRRVHLALASAIVVHALATSAMAALPTTQPELSNYAPAPANRPWMPPQGQPPLFGGAATGDAASGQEWSFKGGNLVGGFNNKAGFFLATADGQTYLHPGMFFQGLPAYDLTHGRSPEATGVVQLDVDGSLFSRDLTYNFQLNFGSSADGSPPTVEVAEVSYAFYHGVYDHDLSLQVGAFKNPLFKESGHIQDWDGLMVQRSLAEDLVGGGQYGEQVRGVGVHYLGDDGQPLRASLTGYEGTDIGATGLTAIGSITGGIAARADYKFWGNWTDTTDLTGVTDGRADLLDVGGGIAYEDAHGNGGVRLTVDGQYQIARQWTAFASAYFDHFGVAHAASDTRNDFGFAVEGGYRIIPEVQLVARYSITRLSPSFPAVGTRSVFNELSIGANYFLGPKGSWANHARIGVDLTFLPTGSPSNHVLYTASASDEFSLRGLVQFQF